MLDSQVSPVNQILTLPQSLNNNNKKSIDLIPNNQSPNSLTSSPVSRVVTTSDNSMTFTDPSLGSTQHTTSSVHTTNQQESSDEPPAHGQQNEDPVLDIDDPLYESTSILINEQVDENRIEQINDNETNTSKNDIKNNEPKEGEVNNIDASSLKEFQDALNSFSPGDKGLVMDDGASYIQDEQSDKIILNNFTRRKPLKRNSTNEVLITNKLSTRNSVMTTGSHVASVDAATFEVERIRSSVINQRKKKKEKILVEEDDEKVLVGNKVSEGHANFVVAYNMLTGIRFSASRHPGIMKTLTDQDFSSCKKFVFDTAGNELTPSSKYAFKFKDYAPDVFRELRVLFGLDPADYLMSLTSKYIVSELHSPGKSGSFLYYSRDYRYIIKTIHRSEHHSLRRILKDYHSHVKNNSNTLICQFYGLHRVKMPISYGKRRKIYFIVMNNLFPPHKDIHRTFDLKGSLLGRLTVPKENQHVVFKDLNWIEENKVIKLGPDILDTFIEQLRKDVELLIKLKIMDYSFLIGFHNLESNFNETNIQQNNLSFFDPPSSKLKDVKKTNPKRMNRVSDLPAIQYHDGNIFHSVEGGIIATGPDNEPLNEMYYFGVIDCLTHYSIVKRMETFWRSLTNDRKIISSVPPDEYGRRFLSFIEQSINENTLSNEKSKND